MTAAETEPAPAKVNLFLHVTGRRADGYHLLDSLVVFAGAADRVTAAPGDGLTLSIEGPEAGGLAAAVLGQGRRLEAGKDRQLARQQHHRRAQASDRAAGMQRRPGPVGRQPLNAGRKEIELHWMYRRRPGAGLLWCQFGRSRPVAQARTASTRCGPGKSRPSARPEA